MAAKTKKIEKTYIVAVKDYDKTMEAITNGTMYVSQYKDIYPELFNNSMAKAGDIKDIRKFIRDTKQNKKDVKHYWESLTSNGYTLFHILYERETPPIEILFSNNVLKFVSKVQ
jgi:hypothetical protein